MLTGLGRADGHAGGLLIALGAAAWIWAGVWFWLRMRATRLHYPVSFWWTFNWLYCRLLFRMRRVGPCTVPSEGSAVIVANHTCGIDPLLVVANIPGRVPAFMVAQEFSDPPVGGRIMRMIECIPVRRDGNDTAPTRAALRRLKTGKLLAIFIEGRIPHPGEVAEAKDGAAVLALRSGALVVPVHISGTIWDPGLLRSFFRLHHARVQFGQPIDLRAVAGPRPDKETLGKISAMILDRIRRIPETEGPSKPGGQTTRVSL